MKDNFVQRLDRLELVEGIEAVPSSMQHDRVRPVAAVESASNLGLPLSDLETFRQHGWSFARVVSSLASKESRPVFLDVDGHLKIDSGSMAVKFAEHVPMSEINSLLEEHGLIVGRKLGFASNLFAVKRSPGSSVTSNSVDLSKELSGIAQVEYAEPMLIEPMAGR